MSAAATERECHLLRHLIRRACDAGISGDAPFAAAVVDEDGAIVVETVNTAVRDELATRHAEINALEQAQHLIGNGALHGTLISSAEPCPMCAGAACWAGIGRIVYGASIAAIHTAEGSASRQIQIPCHDIANAAPHPITVIGPVLEEEALAPWTSRC